MLKIGLVTQALSLTKEHTFRIWFNEQWEEIYPSLTRLTEGRPITEILPSHTPFERTFLLNGTTKAEREARAEFTVNESNAKPILYVE
jgi:hypothetical protein